MAFKEKLQSGKFLVTPDSGEKIQLEILKKFSGEKRVYLGAELYEMVNQLIRDGIRNSHPSFKGTEIDRMAKEIISPWCKKKH